MREDMTSGADERLETVQIQVGIRQSSERDGNERNKASRPSSSFAEYNCECATRVCEETVSLTVDEYEEVRRVPTHFVVARGHVDARVEFVVRRRCAIRW